MAEIDRFDEMSTVFKALADPTRLRILGRIAEAPQTGKQLSESLQVPAPGISHHMEKLVHAGIVSVRRDGQSRWYSLDQRAMHQMVGLYAPLDRQLKAEKPADPSERYRREIRERFFDGNRLTQLPAGRKKRVVVLQYLAEKFEPGASYDEKQVNAILREAHEDVATLRRELVDYGYLQRSEGVYQLATEIPGRSKQVGQEFATDESAWFRALIAGAMRQE